MADLQLSSAVLEELATAFGGFASRLDAARSAIGAGDAEVDGADPLAGPVHAFADGWNYGVTQLGEHAAGCEAMLRQVGAAFDRLERELVAGLAPRGARG